LLFVLVIASACGKNTDPPPPSTGVPGAKPESGPGHRPAAGTKKSPDEAAAALFGMLCVTCHGTDGRGDGPMAEKLNPKPRNYTDPVWQASVTDDDIKKIIVKGGKGVGKSEMMPGQPQLDGDPELDSLVKIIRGFGKK
jgi:mono/diheme cytochrome c family protein